eukprot:c33374_g1_i1.p1 GENE.c33374_g1_i1~~c33374_g1_i1.p1  ORF type:complete len:147 (+),score=12.34 c33374_g1_i1:69-509(+)
MLRAMTLSTRALATPASLALVARRLYAARAGESDYFEVTNKYVDQVKKLLGSKPPGTFLRLAVVGGEGCHGHAYNFKLDSVTADDDVIFDRQGVVFVVDELSLGKMGRGTRLTHVNSVKESKFIVEANPLADSECGCKVSFGLKGT